MREDRTVTSDSGREDREGREDTQTLPDPGWLPPSDSESEDSERLMGH